MGFIGLGNRGTQLLERFMTHQDVEIAALCDVYKPYTLRDSSQVHERWLASGKTPKMGEDMPRGVKRFSDFREMLEMKDLDAVCIATPDHWHAVQAIQAIKAGKDVFVEKPVTITLNEGRAMVNAQDKSSQIVAVGLNRRGSSVYQNLAREIQGGKIGLLLPMVERLFFADGQLGRPLHGCHPLAGGGNSTGRHYGEQCLWPDKRRPYHPRYDGSDV